MDHFFRNLVELLGSLSSMLLILKSGEKERWKSDGFCYLDLHPFIRCLAELRYVLCAFRLLFMVSSYPDTVCSDIPGGGGFVLSPKISNYSESIPGATAIRGMSSFFLTFTSHCRSTFF